MEMLFFTSKKLKLNIIRNLNKSENGSEIGKQENNSRNQEKENNHNSCSKKERKSETSMLIKNTCVKCKGPKIKPHQANVTLV